MSNLVGIPEEFETGFHVHVMRLKCELKPHMHRVQRRMISVDNFFVFLRLSFFAMNHAREIAVSRASLIFQKRFPDAVNT